MLDLKGGRIMDLFQIILLVVIVGGFELYYIIKNYTTRDLFDIKKYLNKFLSFSILLMIVFIVYSIIMYL